MPEELTTVDGTTYRRLDYATKLAGLALIAVGLEVGGATATGLALGIGGAALGVLTAVIGTHHE